MALASGMEAYPVNAIAVDGDNNIIAGGEFYSTGGIIAPHSARWDHNQWSSLGTGINGDVFAITVTDNNEVYVGGRFGVAGGKPSAYIAKWSEPHLVYLPLVLKNVP